MQKLMSVVPTTDSLPFFVFNIQEVLSNTISSCPRFIFSHLIPERKNTRISNFRLFKPPSGIEPRHPWQQAMRPKDLTSPNFQISEQHIALDTLVRGVWGLAPRPQLGHREPSSRYPGQVRLGWVRLGQVRLGQCMFQFFEDLVIRRNESLPNET